METGNNQVRCVDCAHREICSLKDTYLNAVRAIATISFGTPCSDPDACTVTRLCDLTWIEPVVLKCRHYIKEKEVYREERSFDGY